jgi:hypothetical protein
MLLDMSSPDQRDAGSKIVAPAYPYRKHELVGVSHGVGRQTGLRFIAAEQLEKLASGIVRVR